MNKDTSEIKNYNKYIALFQYLFISHELDI